MDFYSAPSYWGSCNFTDITEFKPTALLSRKPGGTATQKGQGLSQGHVQQDRGETRSREPPLWAKHFPLRHLLHFRFPAWIFLSTGQG